MSDYKDGLVISPTFNPELDIFKHRYSACLPKQGVGLVLINFGFFNFLWSEQKQKKTLCLALHYFLWSDFPFTCRVSGHWGNSEFSMSEPNLTAFLLVISSMFHTTYRSRSEENSDMKPQHYVSCSKWLLWSSWKSQGDRHSLSELLLSLTNGSVEWSTLNAYYLKKGKTSA